MPDLCSKCLCLVFLTIFLFLPCIATAELSDGFSAEDYDTIVEKYNQAIKDDYTVDYFVELKAYYEEKKQSLENYLDASKYYYYTLGRLCLNTKEYEKARVYFEAVGTFGKDTECFYAYAAAHIYEEMENYKAAADAYQKASALPLLSDSTMRAAECMQKYRDGLMQLGDAAYEKGDYEKAKEYYQELSELFSVEGKRKYDECVRAMGSTKVSAITSLYAKDITENSAVLTWQGDAASYAASCQIKGIGPAAAAETISSDSWQVSGLLPNTDYTVTIQPAGATAGMASIDFTTKQPEKLLIDGEKVSIGAANLYRYDLAQFRMVGLPMQQFMQQARWRVKLEQKALELNVYPPESSGFMAVIALGKAPAAPDQLINYACILHLGNGGSYQAADLVSDGRFTLYSNYLIIILNDLLINALQDTRGWRESPMTIDFYINDSYLTTISGTF